ncbi:uncharacterized protein TrAtP1_009078 [Trichoderma atroviride]|uniref:uncharacterized protein n=1 Tax=Hypocrea atroviridis TaxID=63577 RepID=UPI0033316837|nr:hypothetical protein TrAtP1_009078 [Trichoderma atroviride]
MVHRNRDLVKYIWFCLDFQDYDCTKCAPTGRLTEDEMVEMDAIIDTTRCLITTAFENVLDPQYMGSSRPFGARYQYLLAQRLKTLVQIYYFYA